MGLTDDALEARVLAHLDELGGRYEIIRIDPDLADTAAFCAHYGYELDQSANCIVVASRDAPPVVAARLNLATTRLDVNHAVRRLLGVKRLSFAGADLTREVTGMALGGVTPFGLPPTLRLYVDRRVIDAGRVIVGGGSRGLKLLVDTDAFARMPACEVVDDLAKAP